MPNVELKFLCKYLIVFLSVFYWDINLVNEKDTTSFSMSDLSMFNSEFYFNYTGHILFSRELLSNVLCPMNLRNFPLDVQRCTMRFQSYRYQIDEFNFSNALVHTDGTALESASYEIVDPEVLVHIQELFTEKYSEVVVFINLHRRLEFYLYQVRDKPSLRGLLFDNSFSFHISKAARSIMWNQHVIFFPTPENIQHSISSKINNIETLCVSFSPTLKGHYLNFKLVFSYFKKKS